MVAKLVVRSADKSVAMRAEKQAGMMAEMKAERLADKNDSNMKFYFSLFVTACVGYFGRRAPGP